MNELFNKIEKISTNNSTYKAITSAVVTAGIVAVVVFGNIQLTIGG